MRQILKQYFYNAWYFGVKILQRVRFWIKISTTRQILKKNIILKSMILKTKIFLKSTSLRKTIIFNEQILNKFYTQKITFGFNLNHKMRKVGSLRAVLKSTILKKNFFLKSMSLNVQLFLKSMNLNRNVFVKSMILNVKFFLESMILYGIVFVKSLILNWKFYYVSDFQLKRIHRVRFWL